MRKRDCPSRDSPFLVPAGRATPKSVNLSVGGGGPSAREILDTDEPPLPRRQERGIRSVVMLYPLCRFDKSDVSLSRGA